MRTRRCRGSILLLSKFALILLSACASTSWAGADFQLERLSPPQLHVAPGQSTTYSLRIRNNGDLAAPAGVSGSFHILNRFLPAPYTLGPPDDVRCGSISVDNFAGLSFATSSIAPGAFLDCDWPINRPLASKVDTWLAWQTATEHPSTTALTVIGTLTNTSIATRTLAFSIDDHGIGHASVELSIHNGGQFPINEQSAGACYSGGLDVVVLAGGGEEGCGDEYYSPPCFTGGGYGFALPALQAGQTHSCKFEIRSFERYTQPIAANFRIESEQGSGSDVMLLDTNEADSQTLAWLAPIASADTTPLVALRWPPLALLALLCGVLGLRRQRSRAQ